MMDKSCVNYTKKHLAICSSLPLPVIPKNLKFLHSGTGIFSGKAICKRLISTLEGNIGFSHTSTI
jgi:hypothetical protein